MAICQQLFSLIDLTLDVYLSIWSLAGWKTGHVQGREDEVPGRHLHHVCGHAVEIHLTRHNIHRENMALSILHTLYPLPSSSYLTFLSFFPFPLPFYISYSSPVAPSSYLTFLSFYPFPPPFFLYYLSPAASYLTFISFYPFPPPFYIS